MAPATRQRLTQKQQPVYEFIKAYLDQHQYGPYIHEIQKACGIRSYKSAIDRLIALERKGFIKRILNKHRGIALAELPPSGDVSQPDGAPAPQPSPPPPPVSDGVAGSPQVAR